MTTGSRYNREAFAGTRPQIMKWVAVLLALTGTACQASLGDSNLADATATGADARGPDAPVSDAVLPADAPLPDAMPCDAGDVNVVDPATGACYMLFHTIRMWVDARMQCGALSGNTHLAVITSAAENELVAPMAGLLDVWMGGNDIDTEGVWVWITGEALIYDNWRDGEPNNADPDGGENCMIIEGELNGTWDDRRCTRAYAYLCEREP